MWILQVRGNPVQTTDALGIESSAEEWKWGMWTRWASIRGTTIISPIKKWQLRNNKTDVLGKRKYWYKQKKFKNVPTMYQQILPDPGEQQNPPTEIKIAANEYITRFARILRSFHGSFWTRYWRRERDSNPRYAWTYNRFRVYRLRPLGHLSVVWGRRFNWSSISTSY